MEDACMNDTLKKGSEMKITEPLLLQSPPNVVANLYSLFLNWNSNSSAIISDSKRAETKGG